MIAGGACTGLAASVVEAGDVAPLAVLQRKRQLMQRAEYDDGRRLVLLPALFVGCLHAALPLHAKTACP